MPIYEYACGACGHEFEEWQKMSDPPVRTCPKCKKKKVERLISQTAFQLKGGGWYADLYSSSKPGKGDGGEGGADQAAPKDAGAGAKESVGTKAEAKPEAKAESKKSDGKKEPKASSAKKSETRAA